VKYGQIQVIGIQIIKHIQDTFSNIENF
jgi:hypothetical protein